MTTGLQTNNRRHESPQRGDEMPSLQKRDGFTLIEILASMAILVIIVLMITRIFTDSLNTWSIGTDKVEKNITGRAAIDFMVRELTGAVADQHLAFETESNYRLVYLFTNQSDSVWFINFEQEPDVATGVSNTLKRAVRMIQYYVEPMTNELTRTGYAYRYSLKRVTKTSNSMTPPAPYGDTSWITDGTGFEDKNTLADNVAGFELYVYGRRNDGLITNITDYASYDMDSNFTNHEFRLPLWADIYLELLSDADALKANLLTTIDAQKSFVDKKSVRYQARVYFNQGKGYGPDR